MEGFPHGREEPRTRWLEEPSAHGRVGEAENSVARAELAWMSWRGRALGG